MRFADNDWRFCEPSYGQVAAAGYLEARGFKFREHFDVSNCEELAHNLYLAEVELEKQEKQ